MATMGWTDLLSELPPLWETFYILLLWKVSVGYIKNTGLKGTNGDIDAYPLNMTERFKKYDVGGTSKLQIAVVQETPAQS